MVCEAPANYLMQKFPLGKFLSVCMFFWGIIVLCIAFGKNWTDLMILRALQGALECTISPTFMLITGSWYTSREHTFRAVIWGTSNAGMNIISGLINYGIGTHAQKHPGGLAPWKGISFFLGSLTIIDSILVFLTLGTPSEVRWLNADEKRAAAARIVSNQTGTDRQKETKWKWDQVFKLRTIFAIALTETGYRHFQRSTDLVLLLCPDRQCPSQWRKNDIRKAHLGIIRLH